MAKKILVVEDEELNAKFFKLTLTRRGGFEVIVTQDPEEVVKLSREKKIDLILMDVSLSNSYYRGVEVDGLMVTRILKINPKTASIPVILTTAHAMVGDKEEFLKETLADDYISKPIVDPNELVDKINNLIKK
jgi:CheY-like chemotaxis protein